MSQRMEALAKAQARRTALAEIRREVRCLDRRKGLLRAAELVIQPGADAGAMPVVSMLSCVRWIGPVRAGKLVQACHAGRRRLRELDAGEREELAARLWSMAARVEPATPRTPSRLIAKRRGTPYEQFLRRTA